MLCEKDIAEVFLRNVFSSLVKPLLLTMAANNRRGSTQQPEFSPRLLRNKQDQSVKAGFGAIMVFEDNFRDVGSDDNDPMMAGLLFHYDKDANIGTVFELASREVK